MMNLQRFHAPTARQALAKAKMAFGDKTVILSNRTTPNGVEVMAASSDEVDTLAQDNANEAQDLDAVNTATKQSFSSALSSAVKGSVEADAQQLSMSTLSFQDFVRDRMLKRRKGLMTIPADDEATAPGLEQSSKGKDTKRKAKVGIPVRETAAPMPSAASAVQAQINVGLQDLEPQNGGVQATTPKGISDELQSMKALIEERFSTLTWLGETRKSPVRNNLMTQLIGAGYSPHLSRAVLDKLPQDQDAQAAKKWVAQVLERNLKTDGNTLSMTQQGGVFALMGATGVGKTTTCAKLAGWCAREFGPASVGLITLDTYRVGAHEQLRAYGKMMGVVAHLAYDQAALQDLLGLLANKKMVLIDTTGLAPRDPRTRDLINTLNLPKLQRVLVLNACSQGEMLDEVVHAFRTTGTQQAILTKTDEASKLGPALDAAIRHQLMLRGVTTGQRVPEDWEQANPQKLVKQSMHAPKSAYTTTDLDLGFFFSQGASHAATPSSLGALHA
jgi:flagellar biosynthesis protein FlhF